MKTAVLGIAVLALTALAPLAHSGAPTRNGFQLKPTAIDVGEILQGGPPRDGIPALDHPEAVVADQAGWADEEMVLGMTWKGAARAYPIAILNWHELVNDTLEGRPILVSYCPLCGTGIVFDRRVEGEARTFGVSGLLYRSDLLMYDRETESLWSQISAEAVTGPSLGRHLHLLRSSMDHWGTWKKAHPNTTVVTRQTGYRRDYSRSPYGNYAHSRQIAFPVPKDPRYHPKMPTLGLRVPNGPSRAYPAAEIVRQGGQVKETFAGRPVHVAYDSDTQVFRVEAADDLEVVEGYWFAWAAFHPEASVFTSQAAARAAASEPSQVRLEE